MVAVDAVARVCYVAAAALGNRAARDLVRQQGAAQGLIQRNDDSAALLTKLAVPQTFAGPDVELLAGAELIDLPAQSTKDPRSRAVGKSSFALAQKANVEKRSLLTRWPQLNKPDSLSTCVRAGC